MPQRAKGVRLWLHQRKGREAVWIIRDGKRQTSTGRPAGQLAKAEDDLEEYLANRRPDTSKRALAKILIPDVLKLYVLDIAPKLACPALVDYHNTALDSFWGEKHLSDVKGDECRKYVTHREKQGVKAATARRELKTLSAAINHWHRESPLANVPAVTLPEEGKRRERFLERSEACAFLKACRHQKRPDIARFFLIGLYTGTRHDAILRIRWMRSLSDPYVDLQRGILYRRGDTEKETSKRRPPVQLPPRLLAHFRRWAKKDKDKEGEFKFARVIHHNGNGLKKLRADRGWGTIRDEAGLGEDVTPHVLRHTCVTWNLWAGKSTWDVGGLVGADEKTIRDTYGHHRLDAEDRRRKA